MKNEEVLNRVVGWGIMHIISILTGFGVFCALSMSDTSFYYLMAYSFMASSATTMYLMMWRHNMYD